MRDSEKVFRIKYEGEILSTNEIKSKHWRKLKPKVDRLKASFRWLIAEARLPKFNAVELDVTYRSRHDVDNLSSTCKFLMDQLVRAERLPDDKPKYWDKLTIRYDPELKHNTILFDIIKIA